MRHIPVSRPKPPGGDSYNYPQDAPTYAPVVVNIGDEFVLVDDVDEDGGRLERPRVFKLLIERYTHTATHSNPLGGYLTIKANVIPVRIGDGAPELDGGYVDTGIAETVEDWRDPIVVRSVQSGEVRAILNGTTGETETEYIDVEPQP